MVLKGVNRVHNAKTKSYGLERSQLGTQWFIVDPIDSFQDHLTSFYHCVPKWLILRPFELIFVYVYIMYICIICTYMHHIHTCVPLKKCMYTWTIINTCVTSTTKNICEDSCTTYIHMYHIHIHALPKNIHQHTCTIYTNMKNIHILAPPNTTKIEQ